MKAEVLQLNFLPVLDPLPNFRVFRKLVAVEKEPKPSPQVRRFSLPVTQGQEETRAYYWISTDELAGFEEYEASPENNVHLTRWVLLKSLYNALSQSESGSDLKDRIHESLDIPMREHPEGWDILSIEPYYLKSEQTFGIITDFRFKKRDGVDFSREIQKHSLSLTRNYKRNSNFHLDKRSRIREYLSKLKPQLIGMSFIGSNATVKFSGEFYRLPVAQLKPRRYRFAGNAEHHSQFAGVKQFGPYDQGVPKVKLIFAFLNENRPSAVKLFNALAGNSALGQYQGYEELFRSKIEVDPTPVIMSDYSQSEIQNAIKRVLTDGSNPLVVFILPDKDEERYLMIKALFAEAGLPSQACTVSLISSGEELKWSISNIALQIFCKTGGQPWQVQATTSEGLIIGVSQSHKLNDSGKIERYFAFSVLTDNSGVFKSIRVLADSVDHSQYMSALRETLKEELNQASQSYRRVAIHASFRLRHKEMRAIEGVVASEADNNSNCDFSVLKINQQTRFFGMNPNANSLVPFVGSLVKLGGKEFLVWFEGVERNRPTASKAYAGPTHVEILWHSEESDTSDEELVQDLMTLAGANWRGFNARSTPVSVFYCHLVAEFVHNFHSRGLPLPQVEGLRPWFL